MLGDPQDLTLGDPQDLTLGDLRDLTLGDLRDLLVLAFELAPRSDNITAYCGQPAERGMSTTVDY